MRARLALLAVVATTSGVIAQNPVNNFWRWDRSTEFTSRGSNGGNPGYLSQGFAAGHSLGLETLTQSYWVLQDQNPTTRERYNVGTCELNAAGVPDYANLRTFATNLMTPQLNQSTPAAWGITFTGLGTNPHKIARKKCDQVHHTWQFLDQTNWTSDGISIHMGQGAPYNATLLCTGTRHREIPRTEGTTQIVEGLGWSAVSNSTTPRALNRTWRLRTSWAELALNGGSVNGTYGGYYTGLGIGCNNTDPNVGYAALDPDFADIGKSAGGTPRYDDYTWILNAGSANQAAPAIIFFANTCIPNGGAATPFGQLHLDIADPLFTAVGALIMQTGTGAGEKRFSLKFGPGNVNNKLRTTIANFVNWSAQAAVVTSSGLKLSSLFSMRSNLKPAGYTSDMASKAAPKVLTKTAREQSFVIRNDGPGELIVRQVRGTTEFSKATICERTAVRVVGAPAANQLRVETNQTNNVNFVWSWNK